MDRSVYRSGVYSLLYTSQKFSSIQTSSCTCARSLLLFLLLSSFSPPFTPPFSSLVRLLAFSPPALWPRMRAVQTQPVSSGVPWEHYPTFLLLCFLSLPSFCLSPICLQLDVCSPIDCFTEDTSGLCLCPARLYIDPSVLKDVLTNTHTDTYTHKHPLSQLVVSQCPV